MLDKHKMELKAKASSRMARLLRASLPWLALLLTISWTCNAQTLTYWDENGDSAKMEIETRYELATLNTAVTGKGRGKYKTIVPQQVAGYRLGKETFEAKKLEGEWVFAKVIVRGVVTLYVVDEAVLHMLLIRQKGESNLDPLASSTERATAKADSLRDTPIPILMQEDGQYSYVNPLRRGEVRARLKEALPDYDRELATLPSNRARVQLSYFATEVLRYNEWAMEKQRKVLETEKQKSGF